ncbi:hypothetical protein CRG98_037990 [Punica granatum]|uniref:Uncharacterized protein n=1 Tax=Punica granatum TaxID=22663 RepID=A0A2I0ICA3_PUNGR|nr:hypothetical protein CRG98_037990 [Punica granatum]
MSPNPLKVLVESPSCVHPNFVLSGHACTRLCDATWEYPPSRGRATDARENESLLPIYDPKVEGRNIKVAQGLTEKNLNKQNRDLTAMVGVHQSDRMPWQLVEEVRAGEVMLSLKGEAAVDGEESKKLVMLGCCRGIH